jgi:transposase
VKALGHRPVILPPHLVAKYRSGNKTDRNDVKALLEAYRNEDLKAVPMKSVTQQVITALHRLRAAWMKERIARINTVRGLLRELGFFIPVGAREVRPAVWDLIADADSGLPEALREPFAEICLEIAELEERIKVTEKRLADLAKELPVVERLMTIPGIGILSATALVAFVGDIHRFATARHFASYLGLTPSERSSGERRSLGGISKRGDRYLRTLLIQGARALISATKQFGNTDRMRDWAIRLEQRRNNKKARVALANKPARVVWAIWQTDGAVYEAKPIAA